jgi:hypothetical protein
VPKRTTERKEAGVDLACFVARCARVDDMMIDESHLAGKGRQEPRDREPHPARLER